MAWQQWSFHLLDTCFFRDGLPYNKGEGGYGQVEGAFPPYITTLQGAIRTQLAAERGWRPGGTEEWPDELGGNEDPGILQFRGPYIALDDELLFPMPYHVLIKKEVLHGKKEKHNFTLRRLLPGQEVVCDLGEQIRLPQPAEALPGASSPDGFYITRTGLAAILQGNLPGCGHIKSKSELWVEEPHIGLERRDDSRTALESMLYRAVHIRPRPGLKIIVLVHGIPEGWKIATRKVLPLGGEARLAEVETRKLDEVGSRGFLPLLPALEPDKNGRIHFTITLITPGWYEDPGRAILDGPPDVPGRCISACLGRVIQVGGWDLALNLPRPLVPLVPAGSTWFFAAEARDGKIINNLHGRCLGHRKAFGYGQVAIGEWKEEIN
ncbi:type III-B CRISPR module-associated Cmr3 family protein [Moorella naiadis]|uniref:type III-B CRISPR module-associated Cmr3 family protein n=1 Tax=Moorella naiadis (nom. illeg.) TaxID=3093670 RepID=UPI003D9CB8FC